MGVLFTNTMPKITVGVSMNIAVKRIFCASECLENSAVIVIIIISNKVLTEKMTNLWHLAWFQAMPLLLEN